MRLSGLFSANRSRRHARNRGSMPGSVHQLEPRCLLSATSGLDAAVIVDADGLDNDFTSGDDGLHSVAESAGNGRSSGYPDAFEGEVVFEELLEELDGSNIPEHFALSPESIQTAIEELSTDLAFDGSLFESGDVGSLQIVTLAVTTSSGATLPVDLFVWDGGADAVVTTEFLSQVESVLNETLKDVLATGGTASAVEVATTPFGDAAQATSSFADTYGIEPLEVYVDISQDESSEGSPFISGVTVVSEDPLDAEFLIFDEFTFFADEFIEPEFSGDESFQDVTGSTQEAGTLSVSASDESESAADSPGAGSASAAGDSAENDAQKNHRSTDSERSAVDSDSSDRGQPGMHDSRAIVGNESTGRHDHGADHAKQRRRLEHAIRHRQRSAQAAQNTESASTTSRWQRLRIRAAEVARQMAAVAGHSNSQSGSQMALTASTAPFALNWGSRLAAFIQPDLSEQLLGLSNFDTIASNGDDTGKPTYAQLASAAGVLLIAGGATTEAIRRRQNEAETRAKKRSCEATKDTKDNYGIDTE